MTPVEILETLADLAADAHGTGRLLPLHAATLALSGQMGVTAETARKRIRAALASLADVGYTGDRGGRAASVVELCPQRDWRVEMPPRLPRTHLYVASRRANPQAAWHGRNEPMVHTLVDTKQETSHTYGPGHLTLITTVGHLERVCSGFVAAQRKRQEADNARWRAEAQQKWQEARELDPEMVGLLERLETVTGIEVRARRYSRVQALMVTISANDAAQNAALRTILRAGLDVLDPREAS